MNRQGFLLGLYATVGQVLLFRETLAAFHGSELLIGAVLFGWLVWVALGAWLVGRREIRLDPRLLLVAAALTLPLTLVAMRLSPLLVCDVVGEHIPFTTSILFAAVGPLPLGLLSGALFSAIVRTGQKAGNSIVQVYFFEGLGAFVGGVAAAVAVGATASALEAAGWLGVALCAGLLLTKRPGRVEGPLLVGIALLVALLTGGAGAVDRWAERVKHHGYRVLDTIDTHYGRQTIIEREGHVVLVTDNMVEAQTPDEETAESILIPPLLYRPDIKRLLYVGRTEFGVAALLDSLPDVTLTSVDARGELDSRPRECGLDAGRATVETADPVSFLREECLPGAFDAVILDLKALDTYASSRFLTPEVLVWVRRVLGDDGLIYVITPYDTERYVSPDVQPALRLIYASLTEVFPSVAVWPGTSTRFFAGSRAVVSASTGELSAAVAMLPFRPLYLDQARLADMLDDFRRDRLGDDLASSEVGHTLERPRLTSLHALYRSARLRIERSVMGVVQGNSSWLIALPVLLLVWLLTLLRGERRGPRLGLWLYFVGGAVSLAFELLSFYVFQCSAGSLYSQVALLLGTFMLGLSAGAWYASHAARRGIEFLAIVTLLFAGLIFLCTHGIVDPRLTLVYHVLFLLTVALATGALFAAATRRYYNEGRGVNRGTGYAVELAGSGISAMVVTTLLLPAMGLTWLLIAVLMLLAVTLGVTLRTP